MDGSLDDLIYEVRVFYQSLVQVVEKLHNDQNMSLGMRAVLEYQFLKNLKITARGENMFDENYQESVGFGTPRISGCLGFVLTSD